MFKKIPWLHWIVLLTSVFLNNLTNLTPVPPFMGHNVDIVFKNQTLCPPHRILHPCIAVSITKSLSLPLLFLEFLGNFSIFRTQLPRSSFFLVDLILFLKKKNPCNSFASNFMYPLGVCFSLAPFLVWFSSTFYNYVHSLLFTRFALCFI